MHCIAEQVFNTVMSAKSTVYLFCFVHKRTDNALIMPLTTKNVSHNLSRSWIVVNKLLQVINQQRGCRMYHQK
jgi:hypothetical protein